MNIYFSGIGGVGIGALAQLAQDAGHTVQGSDMAESLMSQQLRARGVVVELAQDGTFLRRAHAEAPIDWLVYTAALPPDHPELAVAHELGIKTSKRDELLQRIIAEKNLRLIAVAGTHGKTTTTGMVVWLAKYFGQPVSYCLGTTLSWGPSGRYAPGSEYFVYECDEFDRNFLQFHPYVSLITSLEHDHPDTYPTEADYFAAFRQFAQQSERVFTWRDYEAVLGSDEQVTYLSEPSPYLRLRGEHNRRNASLVLAALESFGVPARFAADGLNKFPGTARRFERLAPGLYSDYGHTPAEIAATLQMAREVARGDVVLVYQPHQNVRQHEIRDQYTNEVFKDASEVYWLPTYLSREPEDLETLPPQTLTQQLHNVHLAEMDDDLWHAIEKARNDGKLVLAMGAGSIDAWVRDRVLR